MDSELVDVLSECFKISVVFKKLVNLPVLLSKKQMNVRKLQMLETAVTSSIGHAYPSLCFFLSTSVSLATLSNTRVIFLQEIVLDN